MEFLSSVQFGFLYIWTGAVWRKRCWLSLTTMVFGKGCSTLVCFCTRSFPRPALKFDFGVGYTVWATFCVTQHILLLLTWCRQVWIDTLRSRVSSAIVSTKKLQFVFLPWVSLLILPNFEQKHLFTICSHFMCFYTPRATLCPVGASFATVLARKQLKQKIKILGEFQSSPNEKSILGCSLPKLRK